MRHTMDCLHPRHLSTRPMGSRLGLVSPSRRPRALRQRSSITETSTASPPLDGDALKHLLDTQRRRMELRRDMLRTKEAAAAAEAQLQGDGAAPWWEADLPPNMELVGSEQELSAAIARGTAAGRLVVVNFFSPECYACKSMQPKLRQIAREREGTLFLKVDGARDGLREYCEAQGVTKIPYFQLYRGGARVAEFSANMRPEKLALLRAQLDEHGGGAGGGGAPQQ
ncbi:MAG: hypothetical protein J3K34DRAFT_409011 [Monoraphidium minutum]|nr:MAG: hypothetical protein J3K34DRAFT_409011 [Monoraphidium minutum]